MSQQRQDTWTRESGYVWSMLGSAVGFANILSFSAQCYKNGGGAFLIPFVAAMVLLGIPLLFLEGSIGNLFSLPLVSSYSKARGTLGRFFAWLAVLTCITIGAFYIVLTGYSLLYSYFTAAGSIPTDTAHFFKHDFLHATGSIVEWGMFSWPIFLMTIFVGVFCWVVLGRKIQAGVEKICSFFLPLLSICVLFFAVIVCFLPGAFDGFVQFLKPDFSKLTEVSLWRDVFGQLFFSFSLGLGIVVGYSRHTKRSTNIPRAMFWVAIGDFGISILAGFAIFGCVGYMSHTSGVPFAEIVKTDSMFEMGFMIFPKILHSFGDTIGTIVGPIFFFCLFIAGVTGVFSIAESAIGNFEVEFSYSRKKAATITMILIITLAIPFCFGSGTSILEALEPMVMGNCMLIGAIAEIIFFMFLCKEMKNHNIWLQHKWAKYSLLTVGLPVLIVILISSFVTEMGHTNSPGFALRWIWFLAIVYLSVHFARKSRVTNEVALDNVA